MCMSASLDNRYKEHWNLSVLSVCLCLRKHLLGRNHHPGLCSGSTAGSSLEQRIRDSFFFFFLHLLLPEQYQPSLFPSENSSACRGIRWRGDLLLRRGTQGRKYACPCIALDKIFLLRSLCSPTEPLQSSKVFLEEGCNTCFFAKTKMKNFHGRQD